jgi:hypothetical protein
MTKYFCYECKNGKSECNAPCIYIDPVGEMSEPPITCSLNDAKWVREICECCGQEI